MRIALVVAVVASGCGTPRLPGAPVAGAACTATQAECVSADAVAYCYGGAWVEVACPGECRNEQSPRCDWSAVKVGDACIGNGTGLVCGSDGNSVMMCADGGVVQRGCDGCTNRGSHFGCPY